jgi:hypothetical protein
LGAGISSTNVFNVLDKTKYIKKYKELHKQKTGHEISDQEALNMFEQLTNLVVVIYKPINK